MLMRSLRTRFTLLTVCAIAIAIAVVTLQCVAFIRSSEKAESEQLLLLLCETGERNLDYYFEDVQKSVGEIAAHVEQDLNGLDDESLRKHVDRMEQYFDDAVHRTDGVLTYYYRINPEISGAVKGFWYTDVNKKGFENRDALVERFDKLNEEINLSAMNEWEQAHITKGLVTFDPHVDHFIIDTVRRADSTMYANKRKRKGLAPE